MVSVNNPIPDLSAGPVDWPAWAEVLGAEREHLRPSELVHVASWLESNAPDTLAFGLELAALVAELNMDQSSVQAALLYRGLRNGIYDREDIAAEFGDQTAFIAQSVAQMANASLLELSNSPLQEHEQEDQVENIKRMLVALINDVRVGVVKLAERVVTLRAAKNSDENRRRRIAQEVRAVFAPLAGRLGIWQLKWELEDLSMRYLESDTYLGVARQLKNKRVEREGRVAHIADQVRALLRGFGVDALVFGRAKHIYSIWRKMTKKGIPIEDVHDALAVRVVVDSLADCYAALGVIHNKWQHIPPEFDDYVASPKENGYRSIHTAVVLPGEGTLEIQIRTQAMHEDAELGVCAHWSYKENFQPQQVSDQFDTKVEWLRQVIEWHEELDGSERLSTLLQHRVSEERIYVSTPAGHVLDLPVRATALDFAFRVHSDVGFSCQGVIVDGQPAHLWDELKTGQRVEVTTQTPAQPSLEWADRALGFAVTDRARAKLVHHFRTLPVAEQASVGEVLLVSRLTALVGAEHRDRVLSAQQNRSSVFVEAGSLRLDGSDILEQWLQADAHTRGWVPGLFSIEVVASNRDGLLLNLTQVLGDLKLQLTGTTGRVSPDAKQAIITLETSIESWRSALVLLSRVQNLADVNQVTFSTLSPAS